MFPPALPRYFIEQCSRLGDTVYDPFSGRGTTPLEACLAARVGIGSDANPLATLLTAAKVRVPHKQECLDRIESLRDSYRRSAVTASAPAEIAMLFDGRRTLPQLLYLRYSLTRTNVDIFLKAALAGILHGNHPSRPSLSRTLSISMPNTFSMSPQYISKYKTKHKLKKYPFDAFDLLSRRCEHLMREGGHTVRGRAFNSDARRAFRALPEDSVDLVITSPPYLRVVRYGKYNWIRLWFIGHSVEQVDRSVGIERTDRRLRLSDRMKLPDYLSFITTVLQGLGRVVRPGGRCILVVGDVVDGDITVNLAQEIFAATRRQVPFQMEDIVTDQIDPGKKVTKIWGGTKGGATTVDRVLILRKHGGRRTPSRNPKTVLNTLLD